ncbi:MAG: hypothetical protein ACU841_14600 [Gammaproteobacteria bacterium]
MWNEKAAMVCKRDTIEFKICFNPQNPACMAIDAARIEATELLIAADGVLWEA